MRLPRSITGRARSTGRSGELAACGPGELAGCWPGELDNCCAGLLANVCTPSAAPCPDELAEDVPVGTDGIGGRGGTVAGNTCAVRCDATSTVTDARSGFGGGIDVGFASE